MPQGNKTILLVDDETSKRRQMRDALRGAGYSVLVASDYTTAMAVYSRSSTNIDILVTALSLPGRNGFELAEALLELQPQLTVLFTSGHAGAELRRFSEMAEGRHFLEKPFKTSDLVDRVGELLLRAEPGGRAMSGM